MAPNTVNSNKEVVQSIIDEAKQNAEMAKDLLDQKDENLNEPGKIAKKMLEEEKEKEKSETIAISTIDDLPATETPYKRENKKNYKIEIKGVSYTFYGNGKTEIIRNENSKEIKEIKNTKEALAEVRKIFDQKGEEEQAEQAKAKATEQKVKEEQQKKDQEREREKEKEKEKEKNKEKEKEEIKNEKKEGIARIETKIEEETSTIRTYQDKKNTRLEITDAKGNIVLEANYEGLEISSDKPPVIKFKKEGLWGVLDAKGKEIMPPKYEDITFLEKETIEYKLDGAYGIANTKGEIIQNNIYLKKTA